MPVRILCICGLLLNPLPSVVFLPELVCGRGRSCLQMRHTGALYYEASSTYPRYYVSSTQLDKTSQFWSE